MIRVLDQLNEDIRQRMRAKPLLGLEGYRSDFEFEFFNVLVLGASGC